MKTKILTILLLLFTLTAQAQNSEKIDSIGYKGIKYNDLTFVVYTTIMGGADEYTVEYEEDGDNNLIVNILCSQKNPTGTYSQVPTIFSVNTDSFDKMFIVVKVRSKTGGTEENPIFSDYRQIGVTGGYLPEIEFGAITEDHLVYAVKTHFVGEDFFVKYEEDGSNINVNIFMTGKNICNLCCPCGIIFSIKKDIYKTAVIYVKHIRWGETTVYGQLTWPRQIDLPVTSAVTHNPATDNDIKILPNPVKDKLFVNLKEERKVSFKIYSLQGGLLLDTEITGSQYTDVSFLNSGLYFVVIDNKYVNKLIKE